LPEPERPKSTATSMPTNVCVETRVSPKAAALVDLDDGSAPGDPHYRVRGMT
jgi:hypothetical protein